MPDQPFEGRRREGGESSAEVAPRRVGIQEIVGSGREAIIDFYGASYRLRITRNQRLILTK